MSTVRRALTASLLALVALAGASAFAEPALPAATAAGPVAEAAAAPDCAAPEAAAVDVGALLGGRSSEPEPETHPCWGKIQPGARMTSPSWCTMNWVFRDNASAWYIGTAGHCVDFIGQRVGVDGVGAFGSVAYRVNGGVGNDFALVRIDADKLDRVDPTLCHWGGPTRLVEAGDAPEEVLMQYGWGTLTYQYQPVRARLFEYDESPGSSVRYVGVSSGGDSGSPVMSADGTALAVHTHRDSQPVYVAAAGLGWKWGTDLSVAVPRAEAALSVDLTLVPGSVAPSLAGTAPVAVPAPP